MLNSNDLKLPNFEASILLIGYIEYIYYTSNSGHYLTHLIQNNYDITFNNGAVHKKEWDNKINNPTLLIIQFN